MEVLQRRVTALCCWMSYGKRLEGCLSRKMIDNEVKTPLCRGGGKGNEIFSSLLEKGEMRNQVQGRVMVRSNI